MTRELPNDFANEILAATPNGYTPWFHVTQKQPEGAPIVLMHCESNNSFYVGHFKLVLLDGVRVTHWMPLVSPGEFEQPRTRFVTRTATTDPGGEMIHPIHGAISREASFKRG